MLKLKNLTKQLILILLLLLITSLGSASVAFADSFSGASTWHDFFCISNELCDVGDFNGDGRDDIILFKRDNEKGSGRGDVIVALSNGKGFTNPTVWNDFFCVGQDICAVGDFNGDGKDDIIAFVRDTSRGREQGDVIVVLSDGQKFNQYPSLWHSSFCINNQICDVGDFDGNGRDDIIAFIRDTKGGRERGDVQVALSVGTSFRPFDWGNRWHDWFCIGREVCGVGDFNGDGKDDIITFIRNTASGHRQGDVHVALSNGSGFSPTGVAPVWHGWFCIGNEVCDVGDFNGDGKDDMVTFLRSTQGGRARGNVYVATSNGSGFIPAGPAPLWHDYFCIGNEVCNVGDFNGDGKDDIIIFVRDAKRGSGRGDVYVALYSPESLPIPTPKPPTPTPTPKPPTPTPKPPPPVSGIGRINIFNCHASKRPLHIWIRESSTLIWQDKGVVNDQYNYWGTCPSPPNPFVLTLENKVYDIVAVDFQSEYCAGNHPTYAGCIRDAVYYLQGEAGGQVRTVTIQQECTKASANPPGSDDSSFDLVPAHSCLATYEKNCNGDERRTA